MTLLDGTNSYSASRENVGTGKSQIPKAILAAMDVLGRRDEIMLIAPTGAATDTIGRNTYHTSLGISINHLQKGSMASRV